MKIMLNPIMKKDFKVTARSMKMAWGLMAYEAVLAFIFILALSMLSMQSGYSYQNIYSELISLFPLIGVAQVSMAALAIPVMTASSISGEKERQTFDIMLTTCLSPMSIVFGKVFSSVVQIMLYVAASIPIMALAFVLGGLSWWTLFLFLIVIFVFATLAGSIGVFCSSISRKSIVSIILAFVSYFLVCFLTVLPMIIAYVSTRGRNAYDSMIFLLLNPIVFLEEFFMLSMTGESLFSGELSDDLGFFTSLLSHGPLWCIISGICMLGLSLFFMFLAAKRIDPLTDKVRKFKKKQPIVQSAFIPKEVNSQDAGKETDQLDFVKEADRAGVNTSEMMNGSDAGKAADSAGSGETEKGIEAVNNAEAVNGSVTENSVEAGNNVEPENKMEAVNGSEAINSTDAGNEAENG